MPREGNMCDSDGADHRTPMNFIDLFCGCGRFTVGMERAGFKCLAAIDFNEEAVTTMQSNLSHIKHVLHRDLTVFTPDELSELIGTEQVDVIVGDLHVKGSQLLVKLMELIMESASRTIRDAIFTGNFSNTLVSSGQKYL